VRGDQLSGKIYYISVFAGIKLNKIMKNFCDLSFPFPYILRANMTIWITRISTGDPTATISS